MILNDDQILSLKDINESFSKMLVPIRLFNDLLNAVKTNDFGLLYDPIVKSRYEASYIKMNEVIQSTIVQRVYNSDDYNKLIIIFTKLYAIMDSLIENRKHITDIARQNIEVVIDHLETFRFSIYTYFDDATKKDIARQIYYYIRRKGTPDMIAHFLYRLGMTHFFISEYRLNRKNGTWLLQGEPIYRTDSTKLWKIPNHDVTIAELDDALWWLEEKDLDKIYNHDYPVKTEGQT